MITLQKKCSVELIGIGSWMGYLTYFLTLIFTFPKPDCTYITLPSGYSQEGVSDTSHTIFDMENRDFQLSLRSVWCQIRSKSQPHWTFSLTQKATWNAERKQRLVKVTCIVNHMLRQKWRQWELKVVNQKELELPWQVLEPAPTWSNLVMRECYQRLWLQGPWSCITVGPKYESVI